MQNLGYLTFRLPVKFNFVYSVYWLCKTAVADVTQEQSETNTLSENRIRLVIQVRKDMTYKSGK